MQQKQLVSNSNSNNNNNNNAPLTETVYFPGSV